MAAVDLIERGTQPPAACRALQEAGAHMILLEATDLIGQSQAFPEETHCYRMLDGEKEKFRTLLGGAK